MVQLLANKLVSEVTMQGFVNQYFVDLEGNRTQSQKFFCNLGHASHRVVFASGLSPLAIVEVEYHGHKIPEYALIRSTNEVVCLVLPDCLNLRTTKMKDSWTYLSLSEDTFYSIQVDQLNLEIGISDLEVHYERRSNRSVISYFDLIINAALTASVG